MKFPKGHQPFGVQGFIEACPTCKNSGTKACRRCRMEVESGYDPKPENSMTNADRKPIEWGSRFQFPENQKIDFDGLQMRVTDKVIVQMIDDYETAVASEIASAARAAGVSDVTVLNKKAILEALQKQIPKKPVELAKSKLHGRCAVCGNSVLVGTRYCDNCGQALDWGADNA